MKTFCNKCNKEVEVIAKVTEGITWDGEPHDFVDYYCKECGNWL